MLSAPFLMLKYYLTSPVRDKTKPKGFHTQTALLNRLFENMEYFLMPKRYQTTETRKGFENYSFVSLRLTEDQRKHFEGWFKDNAGEFEDIVASFTLAGVKVSFTWDDANDCYIASFTDNNYKSENYQKVMTSRAEEWFTALMMNCYKAIVLCEDKPWPVEGKGNKWG